MERLEPRLLLSGTLSGVVFTDANGNGARDAGESGLSGWTVFLDNNQNGALDAGEQSTTTDSAGAYSFTNLADGTYHVAEVPQPGFIQTSPMAAQSAWQEIGPAPIGAELNGGLPDNGHVSGRVVGIAPSPVDPNTIYIAAAGGGVWKTTDAGATWTPLTDAQATTAMGSIAVSQSNPEVIYAGSGESNFSVDNQYGRGILKSTDGGATWTLLGNSIFNRLAISRIVIDPTNPDIVYAGVATARLNTLSGNEGVWKSIDGGATWANVTAASVGSTTTPVTDLVMDPVDSQVLFAGFGNVDGADANGVWESTDAGATWSLATDLPSGTSAGRLSIASSSDGQTVYASFSDPTDANFGHLLGLYRSDDGGATWNQETNTPDYMGGFGWYGEPLAVDPNDSSRVYAASTGNYDNNLVDAVVRSDDGGDTWNNVGVDANGFAPHTDHHALAFDASGNLWDGNDGGVYTTSDFGDTWTDATGNLGLTQLNGIAIDPANPDLVFGGSQDNGTEKFTGSALWTQIVSGDGGQVRYVPATHTLYHTFFYSKGDASTDTFFERSDNGGFSFVTKTAGIDTANDDALFYPPYVVDPTNSARLVLGTNRVYLTTNRGDLWKPISGVLGATGSVVTSVAIAPGNSNVIYATYSDDSVWVTQDGGATWNSATANLPKTAPKKTAAPAVTDPDGGDGLSRFLTGQKGSDGFITVDPSNPLVAYLVRNSFGGGMVYMTTNAGASWTNISGNLPDLPGHALVVDPRTSPGTLYVGTDAGVYVSTDGGGSWNRFGSGLPNTLVSELQISTAGNFLDAATYGRGAWMISLGGSAAGLREYTVTVNAASPSADGNDFGNFPTTFTGSAAADAWYLRRDPASSTPRLQFFNGTTPAGTPAYSLPLALIGAATFTFNLGGGGDQLTLDFSGGDLFPAGSPGVNYTSGAGTNAIAFVGSSGDDVFAARQSGGSTFTDGATGTATPIQLASVQAIRFSGGSGGNDQINVTDGAFIIDAETPAGTPDVSVSAAGSNVKLTFAVSQHLAALSLTSGAAAVVPPGATSNAVTISTVGLSIDAASTLDLTNNSLQVHYAGASPVATIRGYLRTGSTTPSAAGPGLVTSTAPAGFALGYADDRAGTVTVKYTRLGDATLDGAVTFADLLKLAQHYGATPNATWDQGDFNYDGAVTFADLLALAQNYGQAASTDLRRRVPRARPL